MSIIVDDFYLNELNSHGNNDFTHEFLNPYLTKNRLNIDLPYIQSDKLLTQILKYSESHLRFTLLKNDFKLRFFAFLHIFTQKSIFFGNRQRLRSKPKKGSIEQSFDILLKDCYSGLRFYDQTNWGESEYFKKGIIIIRSLTHNQTHPPIYKSIITYIYALKHIFMFKTSNKTRRINNVRGTIAIIFKI